VRWRSAIGKVGEAERVVRMVFRANLEDSEVVSELRGGGVDTRRASTYQGRGGLLMS